MHIKVVFVKIKCDVIADTWAGCKTVLEEEREEEWRVMGG